MDNLQVPNGSSQDDSPVNEGARQRRRYAKRGRSRSLGDVDDLREFLAKIGHTLQRQRRKIVREIYVANLTWKSVWSKALVVVYMLVIWVLAFRDCDSLFEFTKYLTHWAWTVELLYFSYALYLDVHARFAGCTERGSVIARTVCHGLSELSFVLQVVVVLFFWAIIYPEEQWRPLSWELHVHGGGLILIILDYLYRFAGFSVRNRGYILGFAAFYCIFHISTVVFTGEEIYPGINFRSLYSFATFLLGLSTLVYVHKAIYVLTHWAYVKQEAHEFYEISHKILQHNDVVENGKKGFFPKSLKAKIASFKLELTNSSRRVIPPTPLEGKPEHRAARSVENLPAFG